MVGNGLCMDCGEKPARVTLICEPCAQVRFVMANEDPSWFTDLMREAKERYPDAEFDAKKQDGKTTKREQKAKRKPVYTSWD